MSQDMSTFLGGTRRSPPDRSKMIKAKNGAGVTGSSGAEGSGGSGGSGGGRSQQGTGGARGTAAAARRTGRPPSGASAPKRITNRAANCSRNLPGVTAELGGAVSKRATGGGPTRIIQTTATSTLRRRQAPAAPVREPAPRRINEVKWIMMPSQSFVQCSETSSSEDNSLEQAKSPRVEEEEARDVGLDKSSSSGRLHQLEELHPMTLPDEPVGQTRTKVRSSRAFRVPSQRIMHEEELMRAQLLQMLPRRTRTHSSSRYPGRAPNWSPHQLPSRLPSPSPSRLPSPSPSRSEHPIVSRMPSEEDLKDVTLLSQPRLASGLISCAPSPTASPGPSLSRLQSPSTSTDWNPSCSTMDPHAKGPTSSSNSDASPSSSQSSSSSTSESQCRSRNDNIQRSRGGVGSKAIKLTSTVIKIMPAEVRKPIEVPKEKEKEKEQGKVSMPLQAKMSPVFQTKEQAETRQAMNASMVQSIAPPKFTPMVQVVNPISQSVNHVVNQLTAQLKEAAMMQSRDGDKSPEGDAYQAWTSKGPARKPSIYLLLNQPKDQSATSSNAPPKDAWVIQPMEQPKAMTVAKKPSQSLKMHQPKEQTWKQQTNHYMNDPKEHPGHNFSKYMNPPKHRYMNTPMNFEGNQYQNQSRGHSSMVPSRIPSKHQLDFQSGMSRNPYIQKTSKMSCRFKPETQRAHPATTIQPVSLNRVTRPATSLGRPYVVPPPPTQLPDAPTGGKIVRKAQHKVPRTMEDGIDMSYQYFVSIPLKRGRKPQVVRYLYRPMVRQINPPSSPNRRSSRRAKRKGATGGDGEQALAAEKDSQKMDPALEALGGMPLPLEDPSNARNTSQESDKHSFPDPEAAPYEVPPLKLDARYKAMMEQLTQMPYPEDKPGRRHRRRRSNRRARAAGGAEQLAPPEQHLGIGGGDAVRHEMRSLKQVSSIWKSGARLPTLVNYRPGVNRLSTTTGSPISFHSPVQFRPFEEAGVEGFVLPGEPMIRAITYDDIEQQEHQLEREEPHQQHQIEQLLLDLHPEKRKGGATAMVKSVSFHPGDVKESEIRTGSSSSISISLTSSSSCGRTKTKGRRATRKSKAKSKGIAKNRR
uniref:Uncharacterized protein LOC108043829 n=1 Tax=Drosophila rhopaloa TaxID=1041015 RepID=A0A6P4ENE6_DRORH